MTTVEFFDRTPIENIISSLTVVPDKIIFIGDEKTMNRYSSVYDNFIAHRGLSTVLDYKPIKKNNLQDIIDVLSEIVKTENDCVFDLTGGEDLVLVAMGIVYQKYKGNNIRMQRFNVLNGLVTDCDGDGQVVYEGKPNLTVEEQILLYGGKVRYEADGDGRTYPWDLSQEFMNDVRLMWAQCKKNPGLWNSQINILEIAAKMSGDEESLEVSVDKKLLHNRLESANLENKELKYLLQYLEKNHLVSCYAEKDDILTFYFKDLQVKKCLTTAGLVLEMIVLVTALTVTHKDKTPYYTDGINGVSIDWDGEFHQRDDAKKDTENEVDAILMKGLIPVFISCKNGQFKEDELYKLDAVANHFGGQYAKRIMIISYWGKKSPNPAYFRKRAEDMGINLLEGVHKLTEKEFEKQIRSMINYTVKPEKNDAIACQAACNVVN